MKPSEDDGYPEYSASDVPSRRLIYVVGFRYGTATMPGGGGHFWFYQKEDADKEWATELHNEECGGDDGWTAYRFKLWVESGENTDAYREKITTLVDDFIFRDHTHKDFEQPVDLEMILCTLRGRPPVFCD